MNFQNLEYFLTTASEGNITRAAERLHVSQQALSNQIARLEQELGCRLFERKQNLELTYAGLQFKASAEKKQSITYIIILVRKLNEDCIVTRLLSNI